MNQQKQPEYPTEAQVKEMQGARESDDDQKISGILPPLPDYPTDQQIVQSWEAYRKSGQQGILEFLREQRQKREQSKAR